MAQSEQQFQSFSHVRIRLQRMTDARFFAGWVSSFDGKELYVRMSEEATLESGASFHAVINGETSTAECTVVSYRQVGEEAIFYVTGEVRLSEPLENVRYSVDGVMGILQGDGFETEIGLKDVSKTGFGGLVFAPLKRESSCNFQFETPFGSITGKGQIRYCRQEGADVTRHRVGVLIVDMARINVARWTRLRGEDLG